MQPTVADAQSPALAGPQPDRTEVQPSALARMRPGLIGAAVTCPAVASVYMTHVIFPQVGTSFGVSAPDARISFLVASLAYALAFFVFGPLSDAVDARSLARGGAIAIVLLVVLATLVGSFPVFLVVVAAAAIAAAAVPAAMFALLPRVAPQGLAGVYFGLLIGSTVAGITLGRSFTAVLAGWLGWREAFLCIGALNLVSLALIPLLPREESKKGARASLPRTYLVAARLFVDVAVARLLAVGALVFFGYLGVVTFLTLRLHDAPFRYDATTIGLINLIGVIGILGAPLAGRLINHIGAPRVVLASLGTIVLGISALAVATGAVVVALGVLLVFVGVFCCQPAVLFLLARVVSPEQRGAASSIYLLCCLCAGSAATGALGPVWSSGGWTAVVAVGIGVVVLAALLASLQTKRATSGQPASAVTDS